MAVRVVCWEISGNFLRNFSGTLPEKFCGNFPTICDIKIIKNVMERGKKCPQYHLIGYVRMKNSSITEKSLWSMDLKSGHNLDG